MQDMFPATAAELFAFHAVRVVALVLLRDVITFLAFYALEVNDHPNVFLRHDFLNLLDHTGAQAVPAPP
jgi:hypothetical protein